MGAKRQRELEQALERAAKKMMSMALTLENLELGDSALWVRAEAALAFAILHPSEE